MAQGPFQMYEKGLLALLSGVSFQTANVRAMLLTKSHTADIVNDQYLSEITTDEVTDSDYARVAITGKTTGIVAGKVRFDCADISFGDEVSITAKWLVIFVDSGSPGSSNLLWVCDLNTDGADQDVLSDTARFEIIIDALGLSEGTVNQ